MCVGGGGGLLRNSEIVKDRKMTLYSKMSHTFFNVNDIVCISLVAKPTAFRPIETYTYNFALKKR